MTDTEIRIAIAGFCGWKCVNATSDTPKQIDTFHWFKPDGTPAHPWPTGKNLLGYIPDYNNDLNAMHEAEKVLDEIKLSRYRRELQDMFPLSVHFPTAAISASAPQRAEAFLRTIGKWKEAINDRP